MQDTQTQAIVPKRRIWPWLICGSLGLIAGIISALALSEGALGSSKLAVGRWSSDALIGAKAASPWLRARIARVGLLALSKDETLYFDRTTDEEGMPLYETCQYKISGGALLARWWSVTIYNNEQFLPRNTDGASSIDATRALANDVVRWAGYIGTDKPAGEALWLSSKAAGEFSLTLRLYNPTSIDATALSKMDFPKVTLVSCDRAAGDPRP